MIIVSHVMGGFHTAAAYLSAQGENENVRTFEISDPDAKNLDDAFRNMWIIASFSNVIKALHHISINPFQDERLNPSQLTKIVARCEKKYGYQTGEHQRVIVEHLKKDRQHFHVVWNRVSLRSGKAVWPGEHWKKSKQVAREMERELGLQRVRPKRMIRALASAARDGRIPKMLGRYHAITSVLPTYESAHRNKRDENIPDSEKIPFRHAEAETAAIINWAFENGRIDILSQYGFDFNFEAEL
ncbi:MAG: relaxase/mobilization nuclease domain-containing protein [Alphaproteobacteria bacterium]